MFYQAIITLQNFIKKKVERGKRGEMKIT